MQIVRNKIFIELQEYFKINHISANTLKSYKTNIIEFFQYLDRLNMELSDVGNKEIENYILNLKNKKNKNSTINNKLSALSFVFRYLEENGIISKMPLKTKHFQKKELYKAKVINQEEYGQLLRYLDSQERYVKIAIEMMSICGLRVSEVVELKIDNFNFGKNSYIQVLKGKGNKDRIVPILDIGFKKDLIHYIKTEDLNNYDKLIPVGVRSIQYHLARMDLGISPHDLRRFFAINFYNKYRNLVMLRDILGHSSIETTNVYLNIATSDIIKMGV